mmetsp:Transcript_17160/g.25623  ORF Transcript_17160/g.25623 Transcript_17160/m.25623 type:complete len:328 (+) Transcript_17160:879-1862(+)
MTTASASLTSTSTPTSTPTPTPSGSSGEEEEEVLGTPLHPSPHDEGNFKGNENVNENSNNTAYANADGGEGNNNVTPPTSCEGVKPQYGRGERTRNAGMKIDYKRLAGETYSYDSSEELMFNSSGRSGPPRNANNENDPNDNDPVNGHRHGRKYQNHDHDYANKHIPEVIFRSYESSKDVLQTIDDGSQLTVQNLVDPNHSLSIHRPILITDTPESIGMRVPKGSTRKESVKKATTTPSKTKSATAETTTETTTATTDGADTLATGGEGDNTATDTNGNKNVDTPVTITEPITIREIGEEIGMKHPVSVMDVKTQDEMEGWVVTDLL